MFDHHHGITVTPQAMQHFQQLFYIVKTQTLAGTDIKPDNLPQVINATQL